MDTQVVIMAGGVGSRLWPVSTPALPKQFIDLLGVGRTLLQLTADRFLPVADLSHFWVVTSERYVDTVREQLPDIPPAQILAEPEPRNTAPCIAYACRKIAARFPHANVVVTPSDALVLDTQLFTRMIRMALEATQHTASIVTLGIRPTGPHTGYGYIQAEKPQEETLVKVLSFKEKPNLETARRYLAAGGYYWNAGIFVWNVDTINDQIRTHAPGIAAVMDRIEPAFYTETEAAVLKEWFPQCEKISIDYAVMEKSRDIRVVAGDLKWSDLGSWTSVGDHIRPDGQGNACVGEDVRLFDCKGCIVHADGSARVVVQGLENYIVAAKEGNILVCSKEREQDIRSYSE